MEPQPKLLYTKREAAQLLSLSVRSIDYLITSCEIASRRVRRRVLIHRDAIERFAAKIISPSANDKPRGPRRVLKSARQDRSRRS
jgi:excisionase family DNA binding protein